MMSGSKSGEQQGKEQLADQQEQRPQRHDLWRVALYYCYVRMERDDVVSRHAEFQERACQELSLKGRIRVSAEGINGVLSGTLRDLQEYERSLRHELEMLHRNDHDHQVGIEDDNNKKKKESSSSSSSSSLWELDIKYCQLRKDLPVKVQLFDSLSCKKTAQVVSLVDQASSAASSDDSSPNVRSNRKPGYGSRRRRQRRQQRRREKQQQEQQQQEQQVQSSENHHYDNSSSSNKNKQQRQQEINVHRTIQKVYAKSLQTQPTDSSSGSVPHLSPTEWNEQLTALSKDTANHITLLDCRNVYESAVGYFVGASPPDTAAAAAAAAAGNDGNGNGNGNNNLTTTTATTDGAATTSSSHNSNNNNKIKNKSSFSNCTTMLTNTRKYSELPAVLLEQSDVLAQSSHIFMYCTGGVRCERASAFLKTLLEEKMTTAAAGSSGSGSGSSTSHHEADQPQQVEHEKEEEQQQQQPPQPKQMPKIYQLHGGIQRYLEETVVTTSLDNSNNNSRQSDNDGSSSSTATTTTTCLYRGKNFVFDPRRVDPVYNRCHDSCSSSAAATATAGSIVGSCLVCGAPHDDYDCGHAPAEGKETRCCKCRILILVCAKCRPQVLCWGDDDGDNNDSNNDGDDDTVDDDDLRKQQEETAEEEDQGCVSKEPSMTNSLSHTTKRTFTKKKKRMYCGGLDKECWHMPPVQEIQ